MWSILRSATTPQAAAIAGETSCLRNLATAVGLEADPDNLPFCVTSPLTVDETLPPLSTVRIPNRIYMLWAGDCSVLGRLAVRWRSDRNYLTWLGFNVVEMIYDAPRSESQKEEILQRLEQDSKARLLHGLFYVGHGHPYGFGPRSGWDIEYDEIIARTRYRLGFTVLNCCNGGWSKNDDTMEQAGGRDIASQSANVAFHGVKRILWPRLFFYPGHALRAQDVLPAGKQGTHKHQ